MENASRALLIAGTVLISLLIITILVFLFRNMSELKRQEEQQIAVEQEATFNQQYASFEKTLYGSELLSLINKAIDYNQKIDNLQNGYKKMTIHVKLKDPIDNFVTGTDYNISDTNSNEFAKKIDQVNGIKKKYGSSYLERLAALVEAGKWANTYTNPDSGTVEYLINEINAERTTNKIPTGSSSKAQITNDIGVYSGFTEFKRKKFEHKKTEYDTNSNGTGTGRIVLMEYQEK